MVALLCSLALAAGVGVASSVPPAPADMAAFVQGLEALRREARIPGLSVAVVK